MFCMLLQHAKYICLYANVVTCYCSIMLILYCSMLHTCHIYYCIMLYMLYMLLYHAIYVLYMLPFYMLLQPALHVVLKSRQLLNCVSQYRRFRCFGRCSLRCCSARVAKSPTSSTVRRDSTSHRGILRLPSAAIKSQTINSYLQNWNLLSEPPGVERSGCCIGGYVPLISAKR